MPGTTEQDTADVLWMAMFLLLVGVSLAAWCLLAGGLVKDQNPWRSIRHPGPGEARRACIAALVMIGLASVVGAGGYVRGR